MLGIALRALRSRRSQAATLLAIAALIAAAAVAAPLFVFAAMQTVGQRDVQVATAGQRLLSASLPLQDGTDTVGQPTDPAEVAKAAVDIRRYPLLRGFTGVAGFKVPSTVADQAGTVSTNSPMAYRDGLCGHVSVLGQCATPANGAMVSSRTAAALGVAPGDQISINSNEVGHPIVLTVAGVYRPRDPAEPYWGTQNLLGAAATGSAEPGSQSSGAADAVFVAQDTLVNAGAGNVIVTYDLVMEPAALRDQTPGEVATAVVDRYGTLRGAGFTAQTGITTLTNHVIDDQELILVAVPVVAAELALLGWYTLFLAVAAATNVRRADIALLKLRGLTQSRIRRVIGGQNMIPILVGVPLGAAAGWLLARRLGGEISNPDQARLALLLAVGGALLALLGGLLAARLAERSAMRSRVSELMRRMPARRRGWRADVIDLALVLLAAVGVWQLHASAGGQVAGLAVLTPGLIALAIGLIAARLLAPAAARAVGRQLQTGRVRGVLTATYLARRAGLDRIFALVVIAATLAGYAACAWDTSRTARQHRAAQAVGADRVLTVLADTRTGLLAAVRRADPSGHYAMAAARSTSGSGTGSTLAVDSTRLAAVANWLPEYGLSAAQVTALLRPAEPAPVMVTAAGLSLDVSVTGLGLDHVYVMANLIGPNGQRGFASFGPLSAGRHTYAATDPVCATAPGCRLSGLQVSTGTLSTGSVLPPPAPGPRLVVRELDAGGRAVLAPEVLRDRNRWRGTTDPGRTGPILASVSDGLSLLPPEPGVSGQGMSGEAYLIDAPPVLQAITAGVVDTGKTGGVPELDPFGTAPVPAQVVARVPALPRLGNTGTLVDLEYADRISDDGGGADDLQVWLAPGTPGSVVSGLRAAGLTIVGEQTAVAAAASVDAQGPVVALRFQVITAGLGLLLAAASLVLMATVDRERRAEELVALRAQGLSAPDARAVALRSYLLVAAAGAAVGVLGAVVDRFLTGGSLPLFGDGWTVLAAPPSLRPLVLLLALVGIAVVFAAASVVAAYQLLHAVRRRIEGVWS